MKVEPTGHEAVDAVEVGHRDVGQTLLPAMIDEPGLGKHQMRVLSYAEIRPSIANHDMQCAFALGLMTAFAVAHTADAAVLLVRELQLPAVGTNRCESVGAVGQVEFVFGQNGADHPVKPVRHDTDGGAAILADTHKLRETRVDPHGIDKGIERFGRGADQCNLPLHRFPGRRAALLPLLLDHLPIGVGETGEN